MGKFCLGVFSLRFGRRLLGALILLLSVAGVSAHAASNQGSAALHIQVTVVPTVQAATTQQSATSGTGAVSYNLQPSSAPKMTSQVTVQQISASGASSSAKAASQSETGAVLKTTTIVPE
jgi:hypothetical protein